MATATWPATLPLPRVTDYALEPQDPVARTDMEAGPARTRRRSTQTPTHIPVQWRLTAEEMAVFEAWHRYTIKDGAEWFDIDLKTGIGISSHEARFIGMWKAPAENNKTWAVKAKLEVRERAMMDADQLAAVQAFGMVVITTLPERLHRSVMTTNPSIGATA